MSIRAPRPNAKPASPAGRDPGWHSAADAWFKLFGAIVLGYIILAQSIAILRMFASISIILVGGIFLAYFVFPAVSWLNKRLPLWAAIAIVYVIAAVAIAVAMDLLLPTLISQIQGLIADIPKMQASVENFIANPHNTFLSRLPAQLREYILKLPVQIGHALQGNVSTYTSRLFNAIVILIGVVVAAIAIPVVSIYMLGESSLIKRFFLRLLPEQKQERAVLFLSHVDAVIGGFIRGQIIVAAVVGCLVIVALLVLRVPYAFAIGVWAGVTDIIPYIGPFAGAIPAAIIALIYNGPESLIGVVVAFVAINQLEGHFLGPRIVSKTVKITPLAVIFALLIGFQLFGFFGLIVAVPLAGVVRVVLVHLFPEREISNAELKPGLTHDAKADMDPDATDA